MTYGLKLIFEGKTETTSWGYIKQVTVEAEDLEQAERLFTACIDSGDYDEIIEDREFTCSDVFLIK